MCAVSGVYQVTNTLQFIAGDSVIQTEWIQNLPRTAHSTHNNLIRVRSDMVASAE
ncbi:BQ5605_C005g03480 [Microbotryum silenes-dioicae]|uniref:BQ5605_C005g03480 protein n=1 Tax=Microbotryum silenes-dioicae TaxID=796604 RepID=A0A2X0MFF6_9BASI|nr:BQ5605_C005g03480 [Microbotryum silenes-dioicae]